MAYFTPCYYIYHSLLLYLSLLTSNMLCGISFTSLQGTDYYPLLWNYFLDSNLLLDLGARYQCASNGIKMTTVKIMRQREDLHLHIPNNTVSWEFCTFWVYTKPQSLSQHSFPSLWTSESSRDWSPCCSLWRRPWLCPWTLDSPGASLDPCIVTAEMEHKWYDYSNNNFVRNWTSLRNNYYCKSLSSTKISCYK